MSWEATAWAKKARVGGPALKALLLCLADYADPETQECWPSQDQLAGDTEQSTKTVSRQLARLETIGAISRTKRYRRDGRRTSDLYVCHIDRRIDVQATTGQSTTGQIVAPLRPDETRTETTGQSGGTTGQSEATNGQAERGDYQTQLCPRNHQGITTSESLVDPHVGAQPPVAAADAGSIDEIPSRPSDAATRRAGLAVIMRKLSCDEAWATRVARQFDAAASDTIRDHDGYYGRCIDQAIAAGDLGKLLPTQTPRQPECGICHTRHAPEAGCPGPRGNLSGLDDVRAALTAARVGGSGGDDAATSASTEVA